MKTSHIFMKRIIGAFMIPMLLLIMSGCKSKPVTKQAMTSGANVPASQGTISVSKGLNNNTEITIHVSHLAPPEKIAPSATVYVVWIQPRNGAVQNIGAMVLNNKLCGTLVSTTPHRLFKVTITPEPSGRGDQPTNPPVFSAEVNRSN